MYYMYYFSSTLVAPIIPISPFLSSKFEVFSHKTATFIQGCPLFECVYYSRKYRNILIITSVKSLSVCLFCLFVYLETGSKIEAILPEKGFLSWNFPISSNKF